MKKLNRKRGGHAFPKNVDPRYRAFIRTQPCVIVGREKPFRFHGLPAAHVHFCFGHIQACHVKSRGSGGDDAGNLFAACGLAHDEQGRIGVRAFEKRWGVNLKEIAQRLETEYELGRSLAPTHPQEHP